MRRRYESDEGGLEDYDVAQAHEGKAEAERIALSNADGTPRLASRALLDIVPHAGDYAFVHGGVEWTLRILAPEKVHAPGGGYGVVPVFRKLDVHLITRARSFSVARVALEALMKDAQALVDSEAADISKTVGVVLMDENGSFVSAKYLPKRSLSTIYLDPSIKLRMRDEIARFLSEEGDYKMFGIPYRRSFLLAGPPGLGKTSLVHALASEFSRSIYVVTLGPKSTDDSLSSAFKSIHDKRGSIILLEDVDSFFTATRERDDTKSRHSLSFSGLLNALDGLGAPTGVIAVMTTNHLDNLDPALLRPGRIDTILKVEPPTGAQVSSMMAGLLPCLPSDAREDIVARIRAHPACASVSTAVLQKWLFEHRRCSGQELKAALPQLVELCEFYSERAAVHGPRETMYN